MYTCSCVYIFLTVIISQRLLQNNEAYHKNNFSCGDPMVELTERGARILLTVSNVIYVQHA